MVFTPLAQEHWTEVLFWPKGGRMLTGSGAGLDQPGKSATELGSAASTDIMAEAERLKENFDR